MQILDFSNAEKYITVGFSMYLNIYTTLSSLREESTKSLTVIRILIDSFGRWNIRLHRDSMIYLLIDVTNELPHPIYALVRNFHNINETNM